MAERSHESATAGVAGWLEREARRVVAGQLTEGARLDTKARELLGFVGLVLGLLGTAAGIAPDNSDAPEPLFTAASVAAVVLLLVAAGICVVRVLSPRLALLADENSDLLRRAHIQLAWAYVSFAAGLFGASLAVAATLLYPI